MTEPPSEISFRLRVRRDPIHPKWWIAVPLRIGDRAVWMIPNTVASRSVITPQAFRRLRDAGLVGADIFDFRSGLRSGILRNVTIAGQAAPDLEVRIREVDELLVAPGQYIVDGYLGLDYLFGAFASLTVDTQTLRVRLGLRPSTMAR